jgi:hypothetical protein
MHAAMARGLLSFCKNASADLLPLVTISLSPDHTWWLSTKRTFAGLWPLGGRAWVRAVLFLCAQQVQCKSDAHNAPFHSRVSDCCARLLPAGGPIDIGYPCGAIWCVGCPSLAISISCSYPACPIHVHSCCLHPRADRNSVLSQAAVWWKLPRALWVFSRINPIVGRRRLLIGVCVSRCESNAQSDPRTGHPWSPGVSAFGPDW